MNVGILTASRTDNNGTDLQAFAMQTVLKKYVADTEIINYKCKKLENSRKIFYPIGLKGFLRIPWNLYNHVTHEKFRKKFFSYSTKIYDRNNLSNNEYDLIVVGSDQIWNLSITGNDLAFFLPYRNDAQKKYSYAASLGKTDITTWEKKYHLSQYLSDFKGVSLREESGKKALENISVSARCDLDPLLMLHKEEWDKVRKESNHKKKYILVYVVDRNFEAIDFAKKYAKENDLDIIYLGNPLRPIMGITIERFVDIQKWIDYVANAQLVITNSYHCLSFSIIYRRKFSIFWLSKAKQSNARLEDLLRAVGYGKFQDGMIYDLNWDDVEKEIDNRRKDSLRYIESMMN